MVGGDDSRGLELKSLREGAATVDGRIRGLNQEMEEKGKIKRMLKGEKKDGQVIVGTG